ncbi:MAG: ArsR/SmtB family transcription factor [Thermodesulfobacteriota bacterium]
MKPIAYFKALSDSTRVRLVNALGDHELSVNEMVSLLGMGQSRISRHLRILMDAGFLRCRRDGAWAFYGISPDGEARRLLEAVQFTLQDEPLLLADRKRVSTLVEDRRRNTMHFFDTIAPDWDLLKQEIIGDVDLNGAIADWIPPGVTVVDLGCGTGDFLVVAAARAGKAIGVDSSAKMLELARRRFQGNRNKPEFRLGELEHLPLGDGEADCAVVSMVLHHVPDPGTAIAEIRRTLKPGGRLLIAELEKHGSEEMRERFGDRWLGFSRHEMEQYLSGNGFVLDTQRSLALRKSLCLGLFIALKS